MTAHTGNEAGAEETNEVTFFSLMEVQAGLAREAALTLHAGMQDGRDATALRDALKELENRGDDAAHKLFDRLNHAILRPQDRGSIARLARALDDVLDYAFATANHLHLYEIASYPAPLVDVAGMLREQTALLAECVGTLADPGVRDSVEKRLVAVHDLENRADEVTNAAKAALFKEDDVRLILKLKDVYAYLETATDKCEDAADVIRDVLIRHA